MKIKYIYKDTKTKVWKLSSSKTGKSQRNFKTQKDAIEFAHKMTFVTHIAIKKISGWSINAIVTSPQLKNKDSIASREKIKIDPLIKEKEEKAEKTKTKDEIKIQQKKPKMLKLQQKISKWNLMLPLIGLFLIIAVVGTIVLWSIYFNL